MQILRETTAAEIERILIDNNKAQIKELLKKTEENRAFDVLLSSVLKVCGQYNDFLLNGRVLSALSRHFSMLSSLFAYEHSVKFASLIDEDHTSIRTIAALLRGLVFSAQLLSANKLREFVKSEMVALHSRLLPNDPSAASFLSISIFYTLIMEKTYLPTMGAEEQMGALCGIWQEVMNSENSENSAVLQTAAFLFYTSFGQETMASNCAKSMTRKALLKEAFEESRSEKSIYAYDHQLMNFLLANLSSLCLNFPEKKLNHIFEFLVDSASKHCSMKELFIEYTRAPNLRYSDRKANLDQLMISVLADKGIAPEEFQSYLPRERKMLDRKREKPEDLSAWSESKIAEEAAAEGGLRTNFLRLAAKLLKAKKSSFPQVSSFVSLCIGMCQPIAYKVLDELNASATPSALPRNECDTVHDFVMAKLGFLQAAFTHAPNIVRCQAAVICQLLPDFFLQLSVYKTSSEQFKADQLEHELSMLCKSVNKEKEAFHKFIPFALSCSLTGERELNFPTYQLLSACDKYDLALLSTNLPPKEKRKFAILEAQFYESNKIIG